MDLEQYIEYRRRIDLFVALMLGDQAFYDAIVSGDPDIVGDQLTETFPELSATAQQMAVQALLNLPKAELENFVEAMGFVDPGRWG